MPKIIETDLPHDSLSAKYLEQGAFVDCYSVEIARDVSLQRYIQAFYSTPLFKLERGILSLVTGRRASDLDAFQLAQGQVNDFSIWRVEERTSTQILMCDSSHKTRSCLMVKKVTSSQKSVSRLYFGSVVVPDQVFEDGQGKFGFLFHGLGLFHRWYSRALLKSAYRKLLKEADSASNPS